MISEKELATLSDNQLESLSNRFKAQQNDLNTTLLAIVTLLSQRCNGSFNAQGCAPILKDIA